MLVASTQLTELPIGLSEIAQQSGIIIILLYSQLPIVAYDMDNIYAPSKYVSQIYREECNLPILK